MRMFPINRNWKALHYNLNAREEGTLATELLIKLVEIVLTKNLFRFGFLFFFPYRSKGSQWVALSILVM